MMQKLSDISKQIMKKTIDSVTSLFLIKPIQVLSLLCNLRCHVRR